jgi:hypothetical protein
MSSRPNSATTLSIIDLTACSSVTSLRMNRTCAPLVAAAEISATASLPRSWRRPLMTTLVPPEASFKATALPMPEAAPVMSATWFDMTDSFVMIVTLHCAHDPCKDSSLVAPSSDMQNTPIN